MPKLNIDFKQLLSCYEDIRNSGHFTEGKYEALFEHAVEDWSGMHAVVVNSCGSGLFAMYRVAKGFHKSVVVPNNTFYATGAMAREAGYDIIRLADCSREDFCLDMPEAAHVLGEVQSKMLVLTHVGGGLARDYEQIAKYCKRYGITLFEDAAHVFGVGEAGSCAGWHSDGAVFSLYPTKAIPVGEGGVIVTHDAAFAEELRVFRNYGKQVIEGKIVYGPGFNLRMDEWTAAIALLQFQRRTEILERREAAADKLRRVVKPLVDWEPGKSNWYKYIAPADFPAVRQTGKVYQRSDQLLGILGAHARPGTFQNSEWVADNHICLPLDEGLYDNMTVGEVEHWLTGK